MTGVKQYYDIKYPFTANGQEGYFLDLNQNMNDKVLSEILHVIFTTKGTRLRKPDFGTELIKYIFEPSDDLTWNKVNAEIKKAVSTYVPNAAINEVKVYRNENNDDNTILVSVNYSVKKGTVEENNTVTVKI